MVKKKIRLEMQYSSLSTLSRRLESPPQSVKSGVKADDRFPDSSFRAVIPNVVNDPETPIEQRRVVSHADSLVYRHPCT